MTVYAAIAAMLGLIGFIVWYASLDTGELAKVEIDLANVEVVSVNKVENTAKLNVTFLVTNPSEKTITISLINYELYADGVDLGSGAYSAEDVALPGRAIFTPGAKIPLDSTFDLKNSDIGSEIYQTILDGKISSFKAQGVITSESAWSLYEKDFETST